MPEGVLNQLILSYSPLLHRVLNSPNTKEDPQTYQSMASTTSISSINAVLFSKLWQNLLFTNLFCLLTMASLSSKTEILPLLYVLFNSHFITEFL